MDKMKSFSAIVVSILLVVSIGFLLYSNITKNMIDQIFWGFLLISLSLWELSYTIEKRKNKEK